MPTPADQTAASRVMNFSPSRVTTVVPAGTLGDAVDVRAVNCMVTWALTPGVRTRPKSAACRSMSSPLVSSGNTSCMSQGTSWYTSHIW